MGKIPEGERFGDIANSYGLYAENAWIKGSLVSEGAPGENNYAGITSGTGTTIGYSNGKYFPKSTSSAIILWAGANEYTSTGI